MTTAQRPLARPSSAPSLPTSTPGPTPVPSVVDALRMEGHAEAMERYQQLGFTPAQAEDLEARAGLFHLRRGLSLHAAGLELSEAAAIAEQYPGGLELFIERSTQKPATVELARLVASQFTAEEANVLSIMAWLALFKEGTEKGLLLARTIIAERQQGSLEPTKQEIEARLKRTTLPATVRPPDQAAPSAAPTVAPPVRSSQAIPPSSTSDDAACRPEPPGATDVPADSAHALTAIQLAAPTPPGQIASARGVPLPPAPSKGSTNKRPTVQARQAAGPLRPLVAPDMEPSTFAALATAYAHELLAQAAASTTDALPVVAINQAELSLAVSLLRQSNLFRNQLNQSWQRETTTIAEADAGSLEPETVETPDDDTE